MIQLNLLPDVKLQYVRAQRTRRLVLTISTLIAGGAIVIMIFSFAVNLAQKKHLNDLTTDITQETKKLKDEPNINKILTVQNQLASLTALHSAKPDATRLFSDYLNQVTPNNVSLSSIAVDFTKQTISINGTADSLSSVNKYVDTLKFTTYTTDINTKSAKAFNSVVMASFGLTSNTKSSQAASYSVNLSYDKNIFDTTQKTTLNVPSIVSTRSALDQNSDLFQANPANTKQGGQ